MGKKLTTEEFIEQSIKIHGDKYDYSESIYINQSTHIKVLCLIHNTENMVNPTTHLRGYGCRCCFRYKNITKFINDSNIKFNNKFDYSLVYDQYVDNIVPVEIKCPLHGDFSISPRNHLRSENGCNECKKYNYRLEKKNNFIEVSTKIHNGIYDYSLVDYINNETNVKIICPIHNVIEQTPGNHMRGSGCKECYEIRKGDTLRYDVNILRERGNKKYNNKFDYSLVDYKNTDTQVKIICPFHDIFEISPYNHLSSVWGCPQCARDNSNTGHNEVIYFIPYIKELLHFTELRTQESFAKPLDELGAYSVDVYLPKYNLVIEYDEPHHYKSTNLPKDKERQSYIEDTYGCSFIRIDDKEFMSNNFILNQKLAPVIGNHLLTTNIEKFFE